MSDQNITLTLPEALYQRARETAESLSLPLDDVLKQSIALSLPELENDLSKDLRSDLSALSLFSDEELWNIARSKMGEDEQSELESLAELKKQRQLSITEQSKLKRLIQQAEWVMLRKAEAYRLLARRGYKVFSSRSFPTN
jgi:DNA polymerase III delta subunit